MFKKLKNIFKAAEAAAVLQKVFEQHTPNGLSIKSPGDLARRIVDDAWNEKANVFSGCLSVRPHKVSLAFWSLVYAMGHLQVREHSFLLFAQAFSVIYDDLEVNKSNYDLSGVDKMLIVEE